MTTEISLPKVNFSISGYIILVVGLAGISALLLYISPGEFFVWGIKKHIAWFIWGCFFSLLLLMSLFFYLLQQSQSRKEHLPYQPENILRDNEKEDIQTSAAGLFPLITEISHALRHLYGHGWFCKVRILLITGTVAEVEQLTPGLTSQYWQEDRGTLLLWGGDLNGSVDTRWLTALRKLRYRAADGIVWVTSALNGLSEPQHTLTDSGMDDISRGISACYDALGWRLPLYIWSLCLRAGKVDGRITQATGCLLPAGCTPEILTAQLNALTPGLISQGVQQISNNFRHNFLLILADQLIRGSHNIANRLAVFLNPYRPLPLAGVIFSQPSGSAERRIKHHWGKDNHWDILPVTFRELPAGLCPRRPGIRWRRVIAPTTALLMLLSGGWMLVSYASNRNLIITVGEQVVQRSQTERPLAERLQALAALQKILARLQYHSEQGVPWYDRAGLSQNDELLAALLPRYRNSAQPLLRDAAASHLAAQLNAFIALPPDSPLREQQAKAVYDQLKLYLMLARPEHMNAAWFSETLPGYWSQRPGMADALWLGMAPSLLSFYATRLAAEPQWLLLENKTMVSQVRTLLVRMMGERNSESSQYQKILSRSMNQHADMRLEDMTGDTDFSLLFNTNAVISGIFTRQAWEQTVQPSIDKIVEERREEMDWVLADSQPQYQQDSSPDALRNRLTERYFTDFSDAWLEFLNSLSWRHPRTLSDAIDQLALMADARQSPLLALMTTLNTQGQTGGVISGPLVKSAQSLSGGENQNPLDRISDLPGPLDATFGPIRELMDKHRTGEPALSLQNYLSRVTQVRLRLQQITHAVEPEAMAQVLAQTVFQGKAAELTDTRNYGSLIAAALGQEWRDFGRTLLVQPLELAWQQVLAPAADSLNTQWQQAVVSDWNRAFGGRYPFSDSGSEASLPLLAKYLNTDSGRITQFLQTRLKGVLHREGSCWVPDSIYARGLTFNPAFLKAINALSQIADVVFTRGDAGLHFELRPGTTSGVMQTSLVIDSQKLTYVNQMPQWKRLSWPDDTEAPGATLSWISTQAGTRQYADIPGAWGWIRLLGQASVSAYPGKPSSYHLSWKAQDGKALNYTLRTEVEEGPLMLLKLRNFRLPETIFTVNPSRTQTSEPEKDTGELY